MSTTYIHTTLRRTVEERANHRCEYCLFPASENFYPHEIDHVVAEKHGGITAFENLAFACWECNRYKGTDLGSFDPHTSKFSFLFNPRKQEWNEHFSFETDQIMGLTPEGRTTVNLLKMNTVERQTERKILPKETS